ncbi:MAG: hypothetical protein ACKVY0_26940 [Prosthecobacter sp.]
MRKRKFKVCEIRSWNNDSMRFFGVIEVHCLIATLWAMPALGLKSAEQTFKPRKQMKKS